MTVKAQNKPPYIPPQSSISYFHSLLSPGIFPTVDHLLSSLANHILTPPILFCPPPQMATESIRLIHLKSKTVSLHLVHTVPWDKVWTISHIWDRGGETVIPLSGVSWKSTSFSTENRFSIMFEKTRQIVESRGAEYVWIDAACINQDREDEKNEQVPRMGSIYSKSAGCVAFGSLTTDDRFVEIASTYDDGRKAWVCDWFERVWTFQELQLPRQLLFVSGDHVLTRDEVYLSLLMMSPYLTPRFQPPFSHANDPKLSIHDVLNALSPLSRTNTQRALMQTSKRVCCSRHVQDKVYGVLGVLPHLSSSLLVDYSISLTQAVLNLMVLMPPHDVLDALTFNTVPPANDIDNTLYWSGLVMLCGLTEHPSYEKDIYYPTNALVVASEALNPTTMVYNAPLWRVVITKPENDHTVTVSVSVDDTHARTWPSIAALSQYAKLTDDFSKVERSVDYASVVGRAERSLAANWTLLKPLVEKGANAGGGREELLSIVQNPPSRADRGGIPPNRLGDDGLFDQEATVLVCRSKADGSFHYGIVVTPNEDGSWHKVCTAAFSDSCVVAASRTHVEALVVIGK